MVVTILVIISCQSPGGLLQFPPLLLGFQMRLTGHIFLHSGGLYFWIPAPIHPFSPLSVVTPVPSMTSILTVLVIITRGLLPSLKASQPSQCKKQGTFSLTLHH